MKTVTINLYSFDELSTEAQNKAVNEHIKFLNSIPVEYGESQYEFIENTVSDAKESIEANEYLFFENGSLAHTDTRTNITTFHFHTNDFILS